MTYLLSQSAKKHGSVLPEGSVSLDLLLASSGHELPRQHSDKDVSPDTTNQGAEGFFFFLSIILFSQRGETQEASCIKSKFKNLQDRVAWATGICNYRGELAKCVCTAHSCGVFFFWV